MAKIFIFDFDQTLTLHHTFFNPKIFGSDATDQVIKSNLKSAIAKTFRALWRSGNIVAIATYHNDPKLIRRYLELAGLSESEVNSVLLITTTPEDQIKVGQLRLPSNQSLHKNGQIHCLLNMASVLDTDLDEVVFYDDTKRNVDAFNDFFSAQNAVGKALAKSGIKVAERPESNEHLIDAYLRATHKTALETDEALEFKVNVIEPIQPYATSPHKAKPLSAQINPPVVNVNDKAPMKQDVSPKKKDDNAQKPSVFKRFLALLIACYYAAVSILVSCGRNLLRLFGFNRDENKSTSKNYFSSQGLFAKAANENLTVVKRVNPVSSSAIHHDSANDSLSPDEPIVNQPL